MHCLRGKALSKLGQYRHALSDFDKADQSGNHVPDSTCLFLRGKCNFFAESPEAALENFSTAAALNPKHRPTIFYKKQCMRLSEQLIKFEKAWNKKQWRAANAAHAVSISIYAEVGAECPVPAVCRGIRLLIVEADLDGASTQTK